MFQDVVNVKIACTAIAGFKIGKTIKLYVLNSFDPSIRAASTISRETLIN